MGASRSFNPRLRAGGDKANESLLGYRKLFQSTPPRGRRLLDSMDITFSNMFQSTPPRGRRPGQCGSISTQGEFQSTPPRGRRPRASAPTNAKEYRFNPRLRAGGDHIFGDHISLENAFQSTPPRGRRPRWMQVYGGFHTFQSTPPRGRRQRQVSACACKGFTGTIAGICLLMLPGFSSYVYLYNYHLVFQRIT